MPEKALASSDEWFRALAESSRDIVLVRDVDGVLSYCSPAVWASLGYRPEELEGTNERALIHPVDLRIRDGLIVRLLNTNAPQPPAELRLRTKSGVWRWFETIDTNCLENPSVRGIVTNARDITERKAAEVVEGQLHQSQRLESLGQLAGGVAHDFNNLIGAILNYAVFIAKAVAPAVDGPDGERWAPVLRDAEQIERAAERAAELTRQLLAFGRREVVRPQVLNLNDVVSSVEQLLSRSIGAHVELVMSLRPDVALVMADPGQIEQVLLNLAVNARDAMPGGGRLEIDTDNVPVDEHYAAARPMLVAGEYVRLRVSDTGTGMDREALDHAFEPFFTTKPKGEGSGLGLATVYGIVAQAGGHAQIYSEPGLGTTFTALFPATGETVVSKEQAVESQDRAGGETILVVEDEEVMRDVASRVLAENGYVVLNAAGGSDAIDLVGRHDGPIDLLLTDVVMPQMLGKEVAERICAIRPGLRVLYMSGYAQPVLASQGTLEAGVFLVEKPFTEATLLAKIREVLGAPALC